jgi:hypothetical protein
MNIEVRAYWCLTCIDKDRTLGRTGTYDIWFSSVILKLRIAISSTNAPATVPTTPNILTKLIFHKLNSTPRRRL